MLRLIFRSVKVYKMITVHETLFQHFNRLNILFKHAKRANEHYNTQTLKFYKKKKKNSELSYITKYIVLTSSR